VTLCGKPPLNAVCVHQPCNTGLEDIPVALRTALQQSLRVCDEAIVLPSAARSPESGAFQNVVMRLSGVDGELNSEVFSANWFAGVSVVAVDAAAAEALLRNPAKKAAAMKKLSEQVPSEMADSNVTVGPDLDGDESDRDTKGWTAGFDSPSCCVGIYSARHSRVPGPGLVGMNRVHSAYYLVCKAGGGVAAQTFHSRLETALSHGKSLDECFSEGASPGAQALRRVGLAASRNRKRILAMAADIMGLHMIDTISDNAAAPAAPHRGAVTTIDVTYNALRPVEGTLRSTWQYSAGCVDTTLSSGLMTSSNLAEGFVAFTDSIDSYRLSVRNEAFNSIPFVTPRLRRTRDVALCVADAHKPEGEGHPDAQFVKETFVWKPKPFGTETPLLEPPALWGSHQPEAFLASWARELGVATCKVVRMAPELVCISAMEPAKLRAAVKSLQTKAPELF